MSSESFFIQPQNRKSITTIYAISPINILIENCGNNGGAGRNYGIYSSPTSQANVPGNNSQNIQFQIIVDKLNSRDLLQIRLCELLDQSKMLISTIDTVLFEHIKCEQSLNVSFDGFVEHFIKILDACKRGELFLSLIRGGVGGGNFSDNHSHHPLNSEISTSPRTNGVFYGKLQFFEKRSFRNLIHLCLSIEEPSVKLILHYINQSLAGQQNQYQQLQQQNYKLQKELEYRDEQIAKLKLEINKMGGKLQENENMIIKKYSDHIQRLQEEIQDINGVKDIEKHKLSHTIKTLQDTVDYVTKENYGNAEKLKQELRKTETLQEELKHTKSVGQTQKEELDKLRQELISHKNHERKSDHIQTEQRKQIIDLQGKIAAYEKQKNEICADLEAERLHLNKKRHGLELATDEINKANSIIIKQTRELEQLSKKVELRTEIALQQERRIKEIDDENKCLKIRLTDAEGAIKENQNISSKLKELRDATESINNKYSKKIQDIRLQVQEISTEKKYHRNSSNSTSSNSTANPSNRYLQINNK